jgi:restriction endonuclease S subunit
MNYEKNNWNYQTVWKKRKKGGGGKPTYPICINIPYIWAIENNAVEFLIVGTKLEIVLS